ncbi:type II secretion system protein [Pseudescherichia sp.]|uniref:type II secretion system protein n=1 Tax=Pseudescherichia sp. TaxID=2055881 RepID=UPI0028ADCC9B|nr:type II secretion system protein [Pseudescherichia sp.]
MFKRRDTGFSLLEIIIVMAIAGGLLMTYTRYVRKQADRSSQQNISMALVQEIKGVINFVRDPEIVINDDESNMAEEISNPLYNSETPDADYQIRLSNDVNDIDTGDESEYYLWGDGSDASQQQRYRFISSRCNVKAPKSNYAFEKEYLPCWMSGAAKNTSAYLDRIGFRGSALAGQESSINQIDAIVEFGSNDPNHLLDFARFQPALAQAFADAGNVPSHAWIVHRESSEAHWQLITKDNDGKTPIEFGSVGRNIDTLSHYDSGEFGVRFTFDLNDNDSGSTASDGGNMCWNSEDGQVEMCYEQRTGTGTHGENTVLALGMKDATNTHGDQKLGTLQANLVMENTARRVYIFQRSYGGDLVTDSEGNPEFYQYLDRQSQPFIGEFSVNEITGNVSVNKSDGDDDSLYHYEPYTYDAFELVTPTVTDYITHGGMNSSPVERGEDNKPVYNDGEVNIYINDTANVRYPVQTCPRVEQSITLRDSNGEALVDADNKPRQIKVLRKLFPRLSVAISSVSAYRGVDAGANVYADPSLTRSSLRKTTIGQLAGITAQVEFTEQNFENSPRATGPGRNKGDHVIYNNSKYIWIISSMLGMFDGDTGEGVNVVDPDSVSYTVSRWCSTIPQAGTPADLLDSYQYQ